MVEHEAAADRVSRIQVEDDVRRGQLEVGGDQVADPGDRLAGVLRGEGRNDDPGKDVQRDDGHDQADEEISA